MRRILPEKLAVSQLVKKFHDISGSHVFFNVLTRNRDWLLF
jgi:hypothetical protein